MEVGRLLNSIRETRARKEGLYNIILEIPEDEYFQIYDSLDDKFGADILSQYMNYHGDDGRYSDVKVQHNKNSHIINVYANLHYEGNDHTEQINIPHLE